MATRFAMPSSGPARRTTRSSNCGERPTAGHGTLRTPIRGSGPGSSRSGGRPVSCVLTPVIAPLNVTPLPGCRAPILDQGVAVSSWRLAGSGRFACDAPSGGVFGAHGATRLGCRPPSRPRTTRVLRLQLVRRLQQGVRVVPAPALAPLPLVRKGAGVPRALRQRGLRWPPRHSTAADTAATGGARVLLRRLDNVGHGPAGQSDDSCRGRSQASRPSRAPVSESRSPTSAKPVMCLPRT